MISVFLREQKRYTQEDLAKEFHCSEEKTVRILKRLKEYGVLKAVKANDTQKDLTDLLDEDIEIADVEVGENEYLYVFTFVGVITIEGRVLKCYPKYLLDATAPKAELKQVLKVLEKYNSKEQIIRMYNDTSDSSAFNMLAVMLFRIISSMVLIPTHRILLNPTELVKFSGIEPSTKLSPSLATIVRITRNY